SSIENCASGAAQHDCVFPSALEGEGQGGGYQRRIQSSKYKQTNRKGPPPDPLHGSTSPSRGEGKSAAPHPGKNRRNIERECNSRASDQLAGVASARFARRRLHRARPPARQRLREGIGSRLFVIERNHVLDRSWRKLGSCAAVSGQAARFGAPGLLKV